LLEWGFQVIGLIMHYKNIILDWSGTLVDDLGPVLDATNQIFAHYQKHPWSQEEFKEKFYLPFPKFYAQYLPEATMVELDHHYQKAFKCLQDNVSLLPHALDFLEFCKKENIRLFLLSTIHAEHFAVQSVRLGIKHYFEFPYVQIIDKKLKISQIIADHGLNPRETMFVGDMQHDIDTAHHGGITAVAVLTGYDSEDKLKKASPDLMFGNLHSLQEYLLRHRELPDYFPIATVGALIFNSKDEVLMIQTHKWSHKWGIPGGKIKTNETSEDALIREIKEETALDVEHIRFIMVQDCIRPPEFYKKAHFLLLNYICRTNQTAVVLNQEAEVYRWLPLAEAKKLDLNTPTKILIKEYERQNA